MEHVRVEIIYTLFYVDLSFPLTSMVTNIRNKVIIVL